MAQPDAQLDEHVEARVQTLGRALLEAAGRYRPGPAERIEDWLLSTVVADERFRGRLLRYMDVLASLDYDAGGREAKRLAGEYFGDSFPALPRALRWLLRIARDERLPAPLVGETARRAAELFARRFITPPGAETVGATTRYLADHGRTPSFDLLGEAMLSDREAEQYLERYLRLIAQLADDPGAGARTAGNVPVLQVSLKLSSLTAHFTPVDTEGTVARVRPALEAIVEAAEGSGVGIAVDMEQHELRALTWEVFRRTFARGERFGAWPDAGIVLQGYLRDVDEQAAAMIAFARERATAFQVRLVKGAYWDYEGIIAADRGWASPVFVEKAATDAAFERTCAALIDAHRHVRLAVGSHNARAHAVAEALAAAAGLPAGTVEHQTLYRTAEGTSRALAELGWVARDYVPVGELLPGIAYLVRRVLENSSQAGFLLQSRSGADAAELLAPPPARTVAAAARRPDEGRFQRASAAPWHEAAFRDRFADALAATRARWGERIDLSIDGERVEPAEVVAVHSPSHAGDDPVGYAAFAGVESVERAVEVASGGAKRWSATPVAERAKRLRRAAALLEQRAAEFAAWVVHEGGRDRVDAFAEVEEAIDYLNFYATQAERLFAEFAGRVAPRGVVSVIPPWNFPLAIPCGMTAAALAGGNAAVLKPAEQTPLVAQRLTALLHEAGVPRDALICLPGAGETVGRALVESPRVAMVAFTGSRAVGTWMHEAVSRVVLPDGAPKALVAEMGGKNPILVFADADLDEAVEGIVRSSFGHANQKCSAASRVLVARPILERLRGRLVEAARSLRVGPADDPATQMNPIIDGEAHARLLTAAATARSECDVVLDRLDEADGAALALGPLIVELPAARALEARTATEELFGPIVVLIPFEHEAEAYEIANGTAYGLTAGVFSRSPHTVARAARALDAGNVYVNRPTTGARAGVEPFGGMRMSGTGPKAGGPDYLWAFTRRLDAPGDDPADLDTLASAGSQTSAVDLTPLPRSWDAPLERRIEAIEGAAVLLGQQGHRDAGVLLAAAQSGAARAGCARADRASPGPAHRAALRQPAQPGPGARAGRTGGVVAGGVAARGQRGARARLAAARPRRDGAVARRRARERAAAGGGRRRASARARPVARGGVRGRRRRPGAGARALAQPRPDGGRPAFAEGAALTARRPAAARAGLRAPLRVAEGSGGAHAAPRRRPGARRGRGR